MSTVSAKLCCINRELSAEYSFFGLYRSSLLKVTLIASFQIYHTGSGLGLNWTELEVVICCKTISYFSVSSKSGRCQQCLFHK